MSSARIHFANACLHGQVDYAKFLFSLNPASITIIYAQSLFFTTCKNGYLKLAQWLYWLNPSMPNMTETYTFCVVCEKGHLALAQWILSVRPNVQKSMPQNAFRQACRQGHLHVAEWLQTLQPFLYKITLERFDNQTNISHFNYRIRISEHIRWQKRKYAMWMRSGKTVAAANTMFYKMPEDVSRFVVQTFL